LKIIKDSFNEFAKELKWRILQLLFIIIALQALLILFILRGSIPIELTSTAFKNITLIVIVLLTLTVLNVAMTVRWMRSRINMFYTLVSAILRLYREDPSHLGLGDESNGET